MRRPVLPRNEHTYEVSVEQIEVTSLGPTVDPTWRFTDAAGHKHLGLFLCRTLVRVQDDPDEPPFYTDADGEEYNAPTHLECRECGEHVTPGVTGPSPFRQFVPGVTRYYRDGVEITEEQFVTETGYGPTP